MPAGSRSIGWNFHGIPWNERRRRAGARGLIQVKVLASRASR